MSNTDKACNIRALTGKSVGMLLTFGKKCLRVLFYVGITLENFLDGKAKIRGYVLKKKALNYSMENCLDRG
jgi:hypothetical protein